MNLQVPIPPFEQSCSNFWEPGAVGELQVSVNNAEGVAIGQAQHNVPVPLASWGGPLLDHIVLGPGILGRLRGSLFRWKSNHLRAFKSQGCGPLSLEFTF